MSPFNFTILNYNIRQIVKIFSVFLKLVKYLYYSFKNNSTWYCCHFFQIKIFQEKMAGVGVGFICSLLEALLEALLVEIMIKKVVFSART